MTHDRAFAWRCTRRTLVAVIFVGTATYPLWAGALSQATGTQEQPETPASTQPSREADGEAPAGMEEMMEAYAKAAMPGEPHEKLQQLAGNWKATAEFHMPDGQAMTSTGQSKAEMVLGGRFLREEYSGDMMGQPFKGVSFTGYDNVTGQYQSLWMDEMSTGMYYSTGTAEGDTLTFTGEGPDPATGKMKPYKHVITLEGPDRHTLDMHEPGPDGQMTRTVRITYERVQ